MDGPRVRAKESKWSCFSGQSDEPHFLFWQDAVGTRLDSLISSPLEESAFFRPLLSMPDSIPEDVQCGQFFLNFTYKPMLWFLSPSKKFQVFLQQNKVNILRFQEKFEDRMWKAHQRIGRPSPESPEKICLWGQPRNFYELFVNFWISFHWLLDAVQPRIALRTRPACRQRCHVLIFLQVYLPSCRKELGVCSLPDGDAMYQRMLSFHCDVDLSPQQIHQIGHQQVELLKTKMEKVVSSLKAAIACTSNYRKKSFQKRLSKFALCVENCMSSQVMRKLNFSGSLPEFYSHVQNDENSHYDTRVWISMHLLFLNR